MSTGCNCDFIEIEPGRWYYLLEDYDAPKNAWDWREYATAYGPFDTNEEAREHLFNNHSNPGGFSTLPYSGDGPEVDDVLQKLIDDAPARTGALKPRHRFW